MPLVNLIGPAAYESKGHRFESCWVHHLTVDELRAVSGHFFIICFFDFSCPRTMHLLSFNIIRFRFVHCFVHFNISAIGGGVSRGKARAPFGHRSHARHLYADDCRISHSGARRPAHQRTAVPRKSDAMLRASNHLPSSRKRIRAHLRICGLCETPTLFLSHPSLAARVVLFCRHHRHRMADLPIKHKLYHHPKRLFPAVEGTILVFHRLCRLFHAGPTHKGRDRPSSPIRGTAVLGRNSIYLCRSPLYLPQRSLPHLQW